MNIRHIVALLSKFLFVVCIAYVTLTIFFGVPIGNILWMSALITVVGYPIGDLYVLKKLGNFIATIIDFGLVFFVFWLFADHYIESPANQLFGAALAALFISISEFVYHIFIEVSNPLRPSKADVTDPNGQKFATEVGEEFTPSEDDLMNETRNEKNK
ncbi:YndM family protein [Pseudalkalibacillus sp. A8]|uniref:YndM family protein n=1 Tax=Pseudalkalibacillus sp. A8 TaxID=3382641 RepID=UPI0038B6B14E